MRVVIAGASGLIGTALVSTLRRHDHDVIRLVRRPAAGPDEYRWDPYTAALDDAALDGADAVVNLCGAGVGDRRWSGAYKQLLRDSRIVPTDVLAQAVARTGVPMFAGASAVGYYGHTGDRIVDESSPAGTGFLAGLCTDWEAAADPARAAGARTTTLRTAIVLSRHGGMLSRLRPLYRVLLGGRFGDGRQYVSWISLEDQVEALRFVLEHEVEGPVNLTGPAPVTNAEFTRALSRVLHRPAPWVVPGFAARALVGEFADEAVLAGQRAIPAVLETAGFDFRHKTVGEALEAVTAPP
ncbi:TIGR01777 family protein [Rhodococcus triatomae]|uniref:TIGR01777 family protein n=1 Tax=Rhodococcus triatomae TaxID=300028 RepID=A0A1G8D8U8_9NOCA|nr:TIGR01777 family oxidoreductase [Rhodococcus triatomae]QNG18480.1 TIGR01777 family protein [Rhodococcus triatomae]QNG21851.1 TIGR01777 family protein [Rhodococcus triatomae]SDH54003.1 hypothetical protein SAMN05444695_102234 [Rhodococcus triatomae]